MSYEENTVFVWTSCIFNFLAARLCFIQRMKLGYVILCGNFNKKLAQVLDITQRANSMLLWIC